MTEAVDRNKTGLTHRVTATAAASLDALGCKPIETEVPINSGWVADLATFWHPTMTEASKGKMIKRGDRDGFDALCFRYAMPLTIIVEVKVSKADLVRDVGRKYGKGIAPPAGICILAVPSGLVDARWMIDHAPGWSLLSTSRDGRSVVKRDPFYNVHPVHPGDVVDLVCAIAVRRDHRTRYKAMRDWLKHHRAADRENNRAMSISRAISAIARYVIKGEGTGGLNLTQTVQMYMGRGSMPAYLTEDLEKLQAILDEREATP